uniref:Uncharacterized protein n=1 Tax=Pelusios castaneus TaxID=367368 RepID=A0A8C8RQK7_9SAUR
VCFNCLVTHALGFALHITCSFSFRILYDLKSPLALAHSARVSLSFMGLWPGILFSSAKSPVSSQLKTCWGMYPSAAIIPAKVLSGGVSEADS